MNEQLETLNQAQTAALDLTFKFGPRVLVAVAILIAGVLAGRWAAAGRHRTGGDHGKPDAAGKDTERTDRLRQGAAGHGQVRLLGRGHPGALVR